SHAGTDSHFVFQNRRFFTGACMQDAIVLHVGAITYANVEHIATRYGAEPDGRLLAHMHIAYNLGAVSDKGCGVDLRMNSAKGSNHNCLGSARSQMFIA